MSVVKRRSPFAIVPVEVLADERLTLRHIRVLVAILSFRSVDTGIAFPTREEIGERARLPVSRVSTITGELEQLGWLKKEGNGGRSRACRYRFIVPEIALETVTKADTVTDSVTVTEPDTVTDLDTVTDPVTVTESGQNGYQTGNETVTESVRGIEQTNTNQEQTKNPPNPPAAPGGESLAGKKTRIRQERVSLKTFAQRCTERGEKPISDYQPLLDYVRDSGLPGDFVQIAWDVFKAEHLSGGQHANRLKADWRRHFLNYVSKGYYRLWFAKPSGGDKPEYTLTTQGLQAKATIEARNREAA